MSSFLQKLKGKGVGVSDTHEVSSDNLPPKSDVPAGVTQLPVDVKQGDAEITIYAQVPGTEIKDIDVSIEGDNDVITIQGISRRPENLIAHAEEGSISINQGVNDEERDDFTLEECAWGKFFRQIILPQEVDATAAQAKIKDGVLVLHLPLKGHSTNKMRMHVERVDSTTTP
ncbi:MAG: Heat shock protein Hsp20 [Parcubacteria group bacterium GW2011_GWA2_47_7]|nr:MAG: Heat shock protein Hsp20 [Parcubacteria group bacterium GW2011_GWA2_47_7]